MANFITKRIRMNSRKPPISKVGEDGLFNILQFLEQKDLQSAGEASPLFKEALEKERTHRLIQEALDSGNFNQIKELFGAEQLLNQPNTVFEVKDTFGEVKRLTMIEVLIRGNNLGQDSAYFDMAEQMVDNGARLPALYQAIPEPGADAGEVTKYLQHLASCARDLFVVLHTNPAEVFALRGEHGETLLHHVARLGTMLGSNSISLCLHVLFKFTTREQFEAIDDSGSTALHKAAELSGDDRVTADYVFPQLVQQAKQLGCDFSTLNDQGQAILHLAARNSYERQTLGIVLSRINNIKMVLGVTTSELDDSPADLPHAQPGIDINMLSSSESTALFYAVNHMLLEHANTLLDFGADPAIYGNAGRDPVAQATTYIEEFNEIRNDMLVAGQESQVEGLQIQDKINVLIKLRDRMLGIIESKNFGVSEGGSVSTLFSVPTLRQQLGQETSLQDSTPADPYGPGAIVPYRL